MTDIYNVLTMNNIHQNKKKNEAPVNKHLTGYNNCSTEMHFLIQAKKKIILVTIWFKIGFPKGTAKKNH